MTETTLLLIKPNATKNKHIGHIISIIEANGFTIRDMKYFRFTPESAAEFYQEHLGKSFWDNLIRFTISGDIVALLLEKEDAILALRSLIGSVDPQNRKPGTIRDLFAEGITENAVHASDSRDHAAHEIAMIFP
ncbi:MAG: nucleoside-diphosphate kinase [Candidatus Cloacimonetes bacterium HGW-Cloacimonetes-1]|jgi:nucleoside-diphosphate kinase|nr:MAG: nucleoside-diphosphate kinase [Candidatus Cloacimonetes bacterium HGW-Cloacimonetes-1]